jgi:tRNA G46 methylase TrmB
MQCNLQQHTTLAAKKHAMKKAILRYSKQKFSEMQSSHQQHETQQSSRSSSLLAAPISPTPKDIIPLFLPQLNIGPNSLLVDLGCGDGRWLITAAKLCKCQCLGIDVDVGRLKLAELSIEKDELSNQIQVRKQDIFEFVEKDREFLSKADVFILYLFRDAMVKIATVLQQRSDDLKRGIKILCVGFALPGWKAIMVEKRSSLPIYLYGSPNN